MTKNFKRKKLQVIEKSLVLPFIQDPFVVVINDNRSIPATGISELVDAKKLMTLLQRHIAALGEISRVSITYSVLRFFRFLNDSAQVISQETMSQYRAELSKNRAFETNSKYARYQSVVRFVYYLFETGYTTRFEIPVGFRTIPKHSKKTFSEIAGNNLFNFFPALLSIPQGDFDKSELRNQQVIVYSQTCMSAIHSEALAELRAWQCDYNFVDQVIDSITDTEKSVYSAIEDFSAYFQDQRNVNDCFKILFSRYGQNVPSPDYWPLGVYDFLKARRWRVPEIRKVVSGQNLNSNENQAIFSMLQQLEPSEINFYAQISDYRRKSVTEKSVAVGIKILYCRYKRSIPNTAEWPTGLCDFLKHQKWGANRVKAAFFSTSETIGSFLCATLSHTKLAPNVDTAAFYNYMRSYSECFDDNTIRVQLLKRRGQGVDVLLDATDPLIQIYMQWIERLRKILPELFDGQRFLDKKSCPVLLHLWRDKTRVYRIRTVHPSSTSHIVKRCIKRYAIRFDILKPLVGKATGENFRPTMAITSYLVNGSAEKVRKLLNHKRLSHTMSYLNKLDAQTMIDQMQRQQQLGMVESSQKRSQILGRQK